MTISAACGSESTRIVCTFQPIKIAAVDTTKTTAILSLRSDLYDRFFDGQESPLRDFHLRAS
jgi:hypothetical protein